MKSSKRAGEANVPKTTGRVYIVTEEGLMPHKQLSVSSVELPSSSPQLKNPAKAPPNPYNLTKYLILRELTKLNGHGGVPTSILCKRLELGATNVDTLLKKYARFGLVCCTGRIKRKEGGRPFGLWQITDLGKERFYHLEKKITSGESK